MSFIGQFRCCGICRRWLESNCGNLSHPNVGNPDTYTLPPLFHLTIDRTRHDIPGRQRLSGVVFVHKLFSFLFQNAAKAAHGFGNQKEGFSPAGL